MIQLRIRVNLWRFENLWETKKIYLFGNKLYHSMFLNFKVNNLLIFFHSMNNFLKHNYKRIFKLNNINRKVLS
jgi:hypothetical protein